MRVDAARLVDDAAERVAPLGADVRRGPLPAVEADPEVLGQVIDNLLENALHQHGPTPARVRVDARRQRDEWVFTIAMNAALDPAAPDVAECRSLIESMGGEWAVMSSPGKGAQARFTLKA